MTHRKMFKIKMMLLLVAALLIGFTMHAQVTIGSEEAPVTGSLLQLKDKPSVSDGGFNANKGVALPRVLLTEKDQLFPMFESDGSGGYKIGTTLYVKANEDKKHTGLIVYNLTEDGDHDLYPGLYQWDGTEWKSFETKMPEAVFEPGSDCSQYVVHGTYIKDKALDNSNYLTVTVDVTKAGAYTIIVDAIYDALGAMNGYGFTGSGTFFNTGLQTVNLQAQGKPINVHSDPTKPAVGDSLKFIAQGTVRAVPSCVVVPVVDDVAGYSLSCPSISVNGTYIKGTPLDATTNTITIRVAVNAVGSYSIEGSSNAGISFKATGFFSSLGSHTVKLEGTGKPTVNTDIPITIRSNSPDDNTLCSTVAKITLPAMTYAIIGTADYSWKTVRKEAIDNGSSFGSSGIVKIAAFNELWQEDTATGAISHMSAATQPDIILYFAYGADPNASTAATLPNLLADYVKAGGVLIYGSVDNDVTGTNLLLSGIFGAGTAGQSATDPEDNDYQINMLLNDPIINGPFGNLSGKFWGEDNKGSVYVRELPSNSVQICAANNQAANRDINPEYSMIWYNENLNFVYFGDSPAASTSSTATNGWPVIYTGGLPKSKSYGTYATGGGNPYVYNAALEFNVLAWGIKKAATSGINPY